MSINNSIHSSKSPNNKNDDNINNSTSPLSPSTKMAHFIFPSPDCVFQQKSLAKQQQNQLTIESIFPIRFIILILSLGCLSLIVANSLALNFTVICMHKPLNEQNWELTVINF
jgi:hypothetical protein